MKHQISFVGGQLLPVFIGVKEFSPDVIHFVVSHESKNKIGLIKSSLQGISFTENICNPFDFASIRTTCEGILSQVKSSDEVLFNLTGGTKIMVLAAQSLILEKNLNGFYINQDNTLLQLPSYKIEKISTEISVREFLEISGHKLSSCKVLGDFSSDDFQVADEIDNYSRTYDKLFFQINSKLRSTYSKVSSIPIAGQLELNKSVKLHWSVNEIFVEQNGKEILRVKSPNVRELFFNAAWWELIVAREISRWSKAKELLIQCELPFKTNATVMKNEIDVLINLGGKLIFVECKSGMVKQEDINKIRVIKDTYGGVISKSLLVSRFLPSPTILEKCKELSIDVFSCFNGKHEIKSLSQVINALDNLERKLSI